MKIITKEEALAGRYRAMTTEYKIASELWMMENVIKDMKSGGIDYAIVSMPAGLEIWRR